jgi:hypothetical protein
MFNLKYLSSVCAVSVASVVVSGGVVSCKPSTSNLSSEIAPSTDLVMTAEVAKGLKQGSALADKSVLTKDEFIAQLGSEALVIIPIGNSGGLYSEAAGAFVMQELGQVFAMAGTKKTMLLMDFNHEKKPLLDINRAASEASASLNIDRVGMTSRKVLNSDYTPNVLSEIKQVLVSNADDYDTGFHQMVSAMASQMKNTQFIVPILGGGGITEKQGQAWFDALKSGAQNIQIVLDVELLTGRLDKYYNASVRLALTNYDALRAGVTQGTTKLFRKGVPLTQVPAQAELEVIRAEVDKIVADAKAAPK